jgi:signal peptidase II
MIMNKSIRYSAVIIFLITCDQMSKWWAIEHFFKQNISSSNFVTWLTTFEQERLAFMRTEVTSFFNMVMVWNEGVSFGMFSDAHDAMPIVLSIFAILLSCIFAAWLPKAVRPTTTYPICFIIAGALSNVWDRARFGAVADFYDVHIMGYHWPAFNIADSLIVIGVGLLALDTLFLEPKQVQKSDGQHD